MIHIRARECGVMLLAAALLTAGLGDFELESGRVLKDLRLCYRTYGNKNAEGTNVILFPTWFNGTTAQLETYIQDDKAFVDVKKYFVVAVDALGNGVSTSPTNAVKEQRGKAFPKITVGDMVRAQHLLLSRELGIKRLHGVVGISMGGMQAFEWMARYPGFMKKAVSIVGTPQMSATDMTLWVEMGVEQAGKAKGGGRAGGGGGAGGVMGMLEGLLRGGGIRSVPRPENVLAQFNAMAQHNAARHFGGMAGLAKAVKTEVLIFVAEKDQAVAEAAPAEFARQQGARLVKLMGPGGHNAYKTQREEISRETFRFLDGMQAGILQ
jgi:homoserine O-acetyltransferase/O-succinyltransferase